jgi:membrane protease YdiL (CAAX protease family)
MMEVDATLNEGSETGRLSLYFVLACAWTWLLALPAATAWIRHDAPAPYAIACAGLSAFGPLAATLMVARRAERRDIFGHWRADPGWIGLALAAPPLIHFVATVLYAATGNTPDAWVHPPANAEMIAALVVFPIGEEFGWRGFAYPRLVERFGLVKGSLLLGLLWGFWHLAYGITPQKAGFEPFEFLLGMVELPLYSLLIAWVMERSHRSMAVAIAFHAGAHLDHIERARNATVTLHVLHVAVLVVLAGLAARSLQRAGANRGAVCAPSPRAS